MIGGLKWVGQRGLSLVVVVLLLLLLVVVL
jgi:hypothetical protein